MLYEPDLAGKEVRRWRSWEDFMQEWCGRDDFREAMPGLLHGEDPEFAAYLKRLATAVASEQERSGIGAADISRGFE